MNNSGKKGEDRGDGLGCRCGAYGRNECGCPNADWTPSEVYELRDEINRLTAELDTTKKERDNYFDGRNEKIRELIASHAELKVLAVALKRAEIEFEDLQGVCDEHGFYRSEKACMEEIQACQKAISSCPIAMSLIEK